MFANQNMLVCISVCKDWNRMSPHANRLGNHSAKCCLKMRNVLKNLCQYTSQVCDGLVPSRFKLIIFKREVPPGWVVAQCRLRSLSTFQKTTVFENRLVVFEQLAHDPQVLNWRAMYRTLTGNVLMWCAGGKLCGNVPYCVAYGTQPLEAFTPIPV